MYKPNKNVIDIPYNDVAYYVYNTHECISGPWPTYEDAKDMIKTLLECGDNYKEENLYTLSFRIDPSNPYQETEEGPIDL